MVILLQIECIILIKTTHNVDLYGTQKAYQLQKTHIHRLTLNSNRSPLSSTYHFPKWHSIDYQKICKLAAQKSISKNIFMKRLLMISAALIMTFSSFAQFPLGINYGVKAGFGIKGIEASSPFIASDATEQLSLHAGAWARAHVLFLFVQPEIYYEYRDASFDVYSVVDGKVTSNIESTKVKSNQISIPVLFGSSFGPSRIYAGPVYTRTLKNNEGCMGKWPSENIEFIPKENTWGAQIGLGFDIFRLSVDARYELNRNNTTRKIEDGIGAISGKPIYKKSYIDTKANYFTISLAWEL